MILARLFALDLRSLALFRVGLGLTLLLDLASRAVDARAFLTDDGVLPRAMWFRFTDGDLWSLHVATGSLAGAYALLLLAGIVAVAVVVGWHTRAACLISLVLLVSLQNRNLAVSYGFDLLLRTSLLWACFLPIGARCSLDARAPAGTTHLSAGSVALTLQMLLVYVCSGLQKLQDPSWRSLDAVFLGLTTDNHATAYARALAAHVEVTRALSALVLGLELFVPLLLLVPASGRARDALRLFVVAAFVLFHLGTGAFFALGLFPLIGVVAWLPFLPARVWEQRLAHPEAHPEARPDARPKARTRLPARAATGSALGGRAQAALAGALFTIVLAVNVETVVEKPMMAPSLRRLTTWLRLDQTWNMFERPMTDGWFVARAHADGVLVDVLRNGAPLSLDKPASVSASFPSMRWRKYVTGLVRPAGERNRRAFLRSLCRGFNAKGKRVDAIELLMIVERESPDHPPVTTTRSLATLSCR